MSAYRQDEDVHRASERVTLACRALSAAANDLRVAYARGGSPTVEDAGDKVAAETERVCEMAEELSKLASNLSGPAYAATAEAVG